MARLAPWVAVALVGLLLLGAAAPGAEGGAAAALPTPHDMLLQLGPYLFNPSIVRHRGVYLATARTAHMKRIERTNWWFNDAYICMSTSPDFSSVSCRKFDPWQGRFQECLWGSERRVADVDTQGIEDPKLFVWPGKGVYAVFGRKPEALGASPYCRDPIFVQFIVQVVAEDTGDEWSIRRPRELKLGEFGPPVYQELSAASHGEPIKEKNWMPFVHDGHLYMTHGVMPHRVVRINSKGVAVQQFLSTNDALFAPYAGEDVHGGPPVVLIGGGSSGGGGGGAGAVDGADASLGRPYYLGVFHFFRTFGKGIHKVKQYHHYAYKMEARPPFRICAVSDEITLVTRKKESAKNSDWTHQRIWKDTSQTAYVSGLFVDGDRVLMSYGSSDIDARLLTLGISDLEALFKAPFDCSGAAVLDDGGGEPLSALTAGGGGGGGAAANATAAGEFRHSSLKQHRRAHHSKGRR